MTRGSGVFVGRGVLVGMIGSGVFVGKGVLVGMIGSGVFVGKGVLVGVGGSVGVNANGPTSAACEG